MNDLATRLTSIQQAVADACAKCGRNAADVRLIAVSKRKLSEDIRAAYALGQRDFGENYVQELLEKREQLADLTELRWHLIGHLQTRKVQKVVSFVNTVHTVDSERLLHELDKRSAAAGTALPTLIQVDLAGEAQKSGCSPEQALALCASARRLANVAVQGLMTIPPVGEDMALRRSRFAELRDLAGRSAIEQPRLSMGMSGDFELAIAEGATDIRVGTALFGEREPLPTPPLRPRG